MIFSRLSTTAARQLFGELASSEKISPPELTSDYRRLRDLLLAGFPSLVGVSGQGVGSYDTSAGLFLYRTLATEGFNVRTAADDGVWRHLSLCVLPDRVEQRWPHRPEERFWRSRSRIWLRSIWWLTHLAWQGSESSTRAALAGVTTDMVVQLIERPGRGGFRVDLARSLFRERSLYRLGQDDFRALMKLNTARVMVVAPEFSLGGIDGYVSRLRRAVVDDAGSESR